MTAEEHRKHRVSIWVLTTFVAIVALALSTATLIIADRQGRAISAARHAEYRICTRQMTTRASINGPNEPKQLLYDCRPNLRGSAATLLTAAQSSKLRNRVLSGDELP